MNESHKGNRVIPIIHPPITRRTYFSLAKEWGGQNDGKEEINKGDDAPASSLCNEDPQIKPSDPKAAGCNKGCPGCNCT